MHPLSNPCLHVLEEGSVSDFIAACHQHRTLLIIVFVPFTDMSVYASFHLKLLSREDIVQQAGTLKNNVDYNNEMIHLPTGYPNVSSGGNDILVEGENGNLSVFFYTFRGILDNFAGIIYKENNQPPTADDFGCGIMLD